MRQEAGKVLGVSCCCYGNVADWKKSWLGVRQSESGNGQASYGDPPASILASFPPNPGIKSMLGWAKGDDSGPGLLSPTHDLLVAGSWSAGLMHQNDTIIASQPRPLQALHSSHAEPKQARQGQSLSSEPGRISLST